MTAGISPVATRSIPISSGELQVVSTPIPGGNIYSATLQNGYELVHASSVFVAGVPVGTPGMFTTVATTTIQSQGDLETYTVVVPGGLLTISVLQIAGKKASVSLSTTVGGAPGAPLSIGSLPKASGAAPTDILAGNFAGVDGTITLANLINGQTVDTLGLAAVAPAGSDYLLMQGLGSQNITRRLLSDLVAYFAGGIVPVSQLYTASGAINVANRKALVINDAAGVTLAMTLGAGTTDGWELDIKCLGVGDIQVTLTADRRPLTIDLPGTLSGPCSSLSVAWDTTRSTWLAR